MCLSLSAWPIYIIGLSIWGISKIVRNDFKYREVCLLLLVLFISISVGEMTMRIIGHHQTYGEINDDAINHIVFTNYQSPFVSAQKGRGWFYVHDGHSIFESKEVNKEGLSDIDHSIQKTKKRVIVLGDSFTEGAGSTNDSNYVHLLGRCRNDFEFIIGQL